MQTKNSSIPYPQPKEGSGKPKIPLMIELTAIDDFNGGELRRAFQDLLGNPALGLRFTRESPITLSAGATNITLERNEFSCSVAADPLLQKDWDITFKNIELFTTMLGAAGLPDAAREWHDIVALVIYRHQSSASTHISMHDFLTTLSRICNYFCHDLATSLGKHFRSCPNVQPNDYLPLEQLAANICKKRDEPMTEWRMETWSQLIQKYADAIAKFSAQAAPKPDTRPGAASSTEFLLEQ